jgi:broad specificity phosphatase PhoE
VRAQLGAPEIVIAEGLRERRFGHWEGSATGNYAHVWAADETDPVHADGNVEPAAAVLDRATALIAQLERQHRGRDILLVSHGDTLQILQAGFSGVDPPKHRLLTHLAMAEIRPFAPQGRICRLLLSLALGPGYQRPGWLALSLSAASTWGRP